MCLWDTTLFHMYVCGTPAPTPTLQCDHEYLTQTIVITPLWRQPLSLTCLGGSWPALQPAEVLTVFNFSHFSFNYIKLNFNESNWKDLGFQNAVTRFTKQSTCGTSWKLGQARFGEHAFSFLFQNPAFLFWVCLSMSHTVSGVPTFQEYLQLPWTYVTDFVQTKQP